MFNHDLTLSDLSRKKKNHTQTASDCFKYRDRGLNTGGMVGKASANRA